MNTNQDEEEIFLVPLTPFEERGCIKEYNEERFWIELDEEDKNLLYKFIGIPIFKKDFSKFQDGEDIKIVKNVIEHPELKTPAFIFEDGEIVNSKECNEFISIEDAKTILSIK